MTALLPVVIPDTDRAAEALSTHAMPVLVAAASAKAQLRFLEFFASNIRNLHTRRAYSRAVAGFLHWCAKARVPSITVVQLLHVAAWVEQKTHCRRANARRPRRSWVSLPFAVCSTGW